MDPIQISADLLSPDFLAKLTAKDTDPLAENQTPPAENQATPPETTTLPPQAEIAPPETQTPSTSDTPNPYVVDFGLPDLHRAADGSVTNYDEYLTQIKQIGQALGITVQTWGDVQLVKQAIDEQNAYVAKDQMMRHIVKTYNETNDPRVVADSINFLNQKDYKKETSEGVYEVEDDDALVEFYMKRYKLSKSDAMDAVINKFDDDSIEKRIAAVDAREYLAEYQQKIQADWMVKTTQSAQEMKQQMAAQKEYKDSMLKEIHAFIDNTPNFNGVEIKNPAVLKHIIAEKWNDEISPTLIDHFFTNESDPSKRKIRPEVVLESTMLFGHRTPPEVRDAYILAQADKIRNKTFKQVAATTMNLGASPSDSRGGGQTQAPKYDNFADAIKSGAKIIVNGKPLMN